MRRLSIIICLFLLLTTVAPAIAAEQGGESGQASVARGPPSEPGNKSGGPPVTTPAPPVMAAPPDASQGERVRETVREERINNSVDPAGLRTLIRTRQEMQAEEVKTLPQQARARYIHENQVRNAVFFLLAAENMTGIGPHVAQTAREYNASVNAQWKDEMTIERRSGIMRTLFGGDLEAADRIRIQAEENERRIEEIRELIQNSSSTDPELSEILLEQLGPMEEEQRRLQERAMMEEQKKGFFSWILG
ncbi:hypothetical protein J2T58_001924 [Methanocalculus alkaliphilus]|uniref:hypothetical protein n=1 Tax=Methanocalculus alkaliphilus TaxID=768730 RepID=UPI00209E5459|nr:hypothetical protein [Methanocalculus alkaliphilus]MCP1716050.1 hypothetical protein [Methanocalculus alkaliphilus]